MIAAERLVTLASDDIAAICRLIKTTPYVPYGPYHRLIPAERVDRLLQIRTSRLARDPLASWICHGSGYDSAYACWRHLDWDSRMFGMPAARLEYLIAPREYGPGLSSKLQLLDVAIEQCRAAGVRHLSARVDAGDLSTIHALEARDFQLLDGIQTFSTSLGQETAAGVDDIKHEVRLVSPDDVPALLEIARTAYVFDRFHADHAISTETADCINQEWVRNSCLGKAADGVIVACRDTQPVAYVTGKIDWEARDVLGRTFATIVLVATATTERGRGAAKAATQGVLQWFRTQEVDTVEVGTQLRNIPAARLYEGCGFRLIAANLTFRALL